MFKNKIMCVTITGFSYKTSSTISFCMCLIFLLQKFVALAVMFCLLFITKWWNCKLLGLPHHFG